MFYDKKIKYLDYYERGERIKGCGFAKIEARDEELRIELTVSGLYPTDSFAREIMLCSEKQEKQLAQLELSQGRGEFKRVYHSRSDVGGTGIPYWELCGICIHLGGEREISCRWQKSENKPAEMLFKKGAERSLHAAAASIQKPDSRAETAAGDMPVKWIRVERERIPDDVRAAGQGSGREEATGKETEKERTARQEPLRIEAAGKEIERETEKERAARQESLREEATGKETGKETEKERTAEQETLRKETARREPAREERRQPRMLDDKWQQLCAIYPHVQPFRDERDYLSIKPADFLLFPANAYRQVNNSFLLHGYYNYKHLLLSRVERKGEILYYVGVPGNYYEKEKQVALMFGFESFECADEPAENGDFGYYMMRMEL